MKMIISLCLFGFTVALFENFNDEGQKTAHARPPQLPPEQLGPQQPFQKSPQQGFLQPRIPNPYPQQAPNFQILNPQTLVPQTPQLQVKPGSPQLKPMKPGSACLTGQRPQGFCMYTGCPLKTKCRNDFCCPEGDELSGMPGPKEFPGPFGIMLNSQQQDNLKASRPSHHMKNDFDGGKYRSLTGRLISHRWNQYPYA